MSEQQQSQRPQLPPTKGFIIIASLQDAYLKSAIFLADSIKDYYPEANITLFTHEKWQRVIPDGMFDRIHYDVPRSHRAKLWALSRTPYDITCYLDADMVCESEEISTVFDQLTDTADLMITKIRGYNGKISTFPGGELVHHCGMFVYRKTDKVLNFMREWWELYQKQMDGSWQWDTELYPKELRPWDQWSFWWLQNKTEHKLNVEIFEDDARWNFVTGYRSNECVGEIIMKHERLPGGKLP